MAESMHLKLMAAVPCKRFDFAPRCEDGRGGWTFSQFSADRYVAKPDRHAIKLGLAVWAVPAIAGDYIERTELAASFNAAVVGTNVLEWRRPNTGGSHHNAGSVYEWIQDVDAPLDSDGLVSVSIRVKLHSQSDFVSVDGSALVHVTYRNINDELVSPRDYASSLDDDNRSFTC